MTIQEELEAVRAALFNGQANGFPGCLCGNCTRKRGGGQHHNGPCRALHDYRRKEKELEDAIAKETP